MLIEVGIFWKCMYWCCEQTSARLRYAKKNLSHCETSRSLAKKGQNEEPLFALGNTQNEIGCSSSALKAYIRIFSRLVLPFSCSIWRPWPLLSWAQSVRNSADFFKREHGSLLLSSRDSSKCISWCARVPCCTWRSFAYAFWWRDTCTPDSSGWSKPFRWRRTHFSK